MNTAALPNPTPLRGWITTFHGSYKGKKLGPYYSRTWKAAGKIKREYVKPADLERVRAACAAYKEKRKRQSINTQNLTRMIGNMSFVTRLCKRLRTGHVTQEDLNFVEELNEEGYEIPGRPKLRKSHPSSCSDVRALEEGGRACPERGTSRRGPVAARNSLLENVIARSAATHRSRGGGSVDPKSVFMYPSAAKSCQKSLPADHLPFTTYDLPKRKRTATLKAITHMLNKPLFKSYEQESVDQKWNRWARIIKERPRAPANVQRALPEGITREQIQSDVAHVIELFKQKGKLKP